MARGCMVTMVGFMLLGFVVPVVGVIVASVGDGGSGWDGGFEVVEESTEVSEAAPAPAPDLLHEDPAAGLAWLRSAAGDDVALAASLVFYPGYLIAEVEPVDAPGTLARWVLYPDRSIGPDPVAVVSADRVAVGDVAPDVVQEVVTEAIAALAPDGGRATHLIVRPGPGGAGPEYSVYVERADGQSAGYAVYGVLGNLLRTQPAG